MPNTLIDQAIRELRPLRFVYHGSLRVVEPQCHGRGHRGTELLRGCQVNGEGPSERLFDVAEISDLTLLESHFDGPARNYRRNDSAMAEIFCQL
jgi:predicted DNA-binding transcriptional regulator YafY